LEKGKTGGLCDFVTHINELAVILTTNIILMKNIKYLIILFIFVIKTNSLFAQVDEVVPGNITVVESQKIDPYSLEGQLLTGYLKLYQIENFPFEKIYTTNKNILGLTIDNSPKLNYLPENVKEFKHLKKLEISGVSLSQFPIGFCYTEELTTLSYTDCPTTVIPKEIGRLKNLKRLIVKKLPIKVIPKEIGNLENLENLTLEETSGNYIIASVPFKLDGINYIPKEIGNLKKLNQLLLENNNLKAIPKEIGLLDNLIILSLKGNNLTNLPTEIYNLPNLQNLLLSNNAFESLPKDVGNLKNLKILYLQDNKLKSLPENIEKLENLKILSLSNNKLKSLPKSIEKLKNIEIIYIGGNEIPREELIELRKRMANTKIIF
jgi:Leucine-rich repeat (LRR) protein